MLFSNLFCTMDEMEAKEKFLADLNLRKCLIRERVPNPAEDADEEFTTDHELCYSVAPRRISIDAVPQKATTTLRKHRTRSLVQMPSGASAQNSEYPSANTGKSRDQTVTVSPYSALPPIQNGGGGNFASKSAAFQYHEHGDHSMGFYQTKLPPIGSSSGKTKRAKNNTRKNILRLSDNLKCADMGEIHSVSSRRQSDLHGSRGFGKDPASELFIEQQEVIEDGLNTGNTTCPGEPNTSVKNKIKGFFRGAMSSKFF